MYGILGMPYLCRTLGDVFKKQSKNSIPSKKNISTKIILLQKERNSINYLKVKK